MNFLEDVPEEAPKKDENSIWCEKYRPSTLDDYIGNEHLKSKLAQYIDTQDIPHILLAGTAGTGKSSCAKLLVKSIKCDSIYINASDENSVETVRTKIKDFASSMGFHDLKIIILDEFDFFTASAMAALRNLMETYSLHTRFILTCNYQERIIEPILSRCQAYQVIPPNKKDVARLLVKVLTSERVKYNTDSVVSIVQSHYPDIRSVLNVAQRGVVDGELKLDKEAIMDGDIKSKLLEHVKLQDKKQAFKNIRQLLADNSIRNFADFYSLLYDKVDEFAPNSQADVIMAIADAQFRDSSVVDKEINFCAGIINILKSIK